MNNTVLYNITIIMIVALVTWSTRAIPYLIFGGAKKLPSIISYLGNVLPNAIMIILVVYCIRNIDISNILSGAAELTSIGCIIIIQLISKNTILSIILGTILYMALIRTIFV
ncbi:branched-chain amino acid transporter permease [Fusobacterium sp. PH5-44]|uniref:branched-chain amino acid transporter permease n=1 Tax=unclassified Fusobacterium TaxID=2648384 RepID=UPI003D20F8F0